MLISICLHHPVWTGQYPRHARPDLALRLFFLVLKVLPLHYFRKQLILNFGRRLRRSYDTLWQKGRQWAFVWRTMQEILDQADSDIASGEYAARLRFGHDIIVMSLFVLLDIDGYNIPVGEASEVKDVFRSYDFPMSLNVQFVFYRNCSGEVLVRMMYNERDMALPIADCGTPYYYRWEELRAFALERIELAKGIIASTQAPPKVKN